MKVKYILVFGMLYFILATFVFGNNIADKENEFEKLNQVYASQIASLDSLNKLHNIKIAIINELKEKQPIDNDALAEALASTVVISNQIKNQQEQLELTESQIEDVKRSLDSEYAIKIDSLKLIQQKKENSKNEKLQSQILNLIEKRLMVAPKIYSLSFNPQKLIQFDTKEKDSLKQQIYHEYLINALAEVDNQISQIKNHKDEVQEIIFLRNETSDFIEDINDEFQINPVIQLSQSQDKSARTYSDEFGTLGANDLSIINNQANSFIHIFNQLKNTKGIDVKTTLDTPIDSIPTNLTYEQYLELLTKVGELLQDYQTLLRHKLDSD